MSYDESAVFLAREMLLITLKVAAPILGAGALVGLVISILQSVTSIQDPTITFVPKIAVMLIVAGVLLPWMAACLVEYAAWLFTLTSG